MARHSANRKRSVSYVPDQGDIITLSFDPSAGTEIYKRRPAFVISKKIFSEHTGFTIVAPITSTVRNSPLEVVLPVKMETAGAILVYQIKSLDYQACAAILVEKTPASIVQGVLRITRALIS